MKTRNVVLFLALVLITFQSCLPSLHPLYTKDKLLMKKEVLGTWVDRTEERNISLSDKTNISGSLSVKNEFNPMWDFKATKDGISYTLVYSDSEGKPGAFDAHLIKLGKDYFFNFAPRDPTKEDKAAYPELGKDKFNDFETIHYCPVNSFAKVNFIGDKMSIALFDGAFLEDLLEQNLIRIKHEKVDGGYVLTAQPEELQKFVLKYADDEKAFLDPMVLTKK